MKTATIRTAKSLISIEAPEGKDMAIDASLLAHGVLSLGEYGPSGVKIASFKDWDHVWFAPEGYAFKNTRL